MAQHGGKQPAVVDDPEKLLEEAIKVVNRESFSMKRCLDNDKLMEALKHASNMLCELRTSMLSPKTYYELYISITQELRHLEVFLVDQFEKKNPIKDLYELVQYAGNIVPRLYLMVAVGAVYIKSKQVPTKDILKDLVEMTRGVQHPLRGLFLRNYLLQSIKEELPQEAVSEDGTITDSIDFILLNFSEMNKLWVRMQHQGHSRDKDRRERERRELRLLVGKNFERLSSLDNITVNIYKERILPSVLEQVISCKDAIAQEYLMECIIQVFPDDYHLQTLNAFLDACGSLSALVNIKSIIISLIERLAAYTMREGGIVPQDIALFDIFSDQVAAVGKARPDMALEDVISLQVALVHLALKCYSQRPDYVDKVLLHTAQLLDQRSIERVDAGNPVSKELVKLLKTCCDGYPHIQQTLQLAHFLPLFRYLSNDTKKDMALYLLEVVCAKDSRLDSLEHVTTFLDLIAPLLQDQAGAVGAQLAAEDPEGFAAEQGLVARFITLLRGETPDVQFQILSLVRKQVVAGGDIRIKHTLPSVVFAAYQLVAVYKGLEGKDELWEKKIQKIFSFCHQCISALAKAEQTLLALRLFLVGAQVADAAPCEKSETIAYEFMTQAVLLYEEEVSDSKAQISAITLLIGAFENISCFSEEMYTPLITKCALLSTKLMKKPDQCRCVSLCAHLFWSGKVAESSDEKRDSKQVLQCLQKAVKIATTVMEPPVQAQLCAEILARFVLFYDKGVDQITPAHLSKMVSMIEETLGRAEAGEEVEQVKAQFAAVLKYIKLKKASSGPGPSYAEVALPDGFA